MDFNSKVFLLISILLSFASLSESVRCYECRSDFHRNCGDPFVPIKVPVVDCSLLSTNPVVMCFKASQAVAGQYITVRGCSPFDTKTFNTGFQKGMQGTYWNGWNLFSLCDYDNCNGANRSKGSLSSLLVITAVIAYLRL